MAYDVILSFYINQPLLFHITVIVVSMFLLAKASSLTVLGISNYAKKVGISEYFTGLIIVAIAASVPEFLASLSGVVFGEPDVVFATIFGSNLIGLTLVMGIFAVVGKKLIVHEKVFESTKWDIIILTALPFILLADGALRRLDGIILILSYVAYMYILWKRQGETGTLKKNVPLSLIYQDGLIFVLSLVTVFISSTFLVSSSLTIATILQISPFITTLVIIGLGAQVPDLFLGIQAMLKGHSAVALGDIIGSMTTKSLLFLGIFAVIKDLQFSVQNTFFTGAMTVLTTILLFIFVRDKSITSRQGWYLIILYFFFMAVQLLAFA